MFLSTSISSLKYINLSLNPFILDRFNSIALELNVGKNVSFSKNIVMMYKIEFWMISNHPTWLFDHMSQNVFCQSKEGYILFHELHIVVYPNLYIFVHHSQFERPAYNIYCILPAIFGSLPSTHKITASTFMKTSIPFLYNSKKKKFNRGILYTASVKLTVINIKANILSYFVELSNFLERYSYSITILTKLVSHYYIIVI